MSNKKIAVISKNARLSSLIEAELIMLDLSVETFEELKYPRDDFDGYIFDCCDNTNIFKNNAPIRVAITEKEPSEQLLQGATHILSYPVKLFELRSIFISSSQKEENQKSQEPIIFADKDELTVRLNGRRIKLSSYEFTVLEILCAHAGECVHRSLLSEALGASDSNITEVYICHLRKKLEADSGSKIIYTVRQKGYMTNYKMT